MKPRMTLDRAELILKWLADLDDPQLRHTTSPVQWIALKLSCSAIKAADAIEEAQAVVAEGRKQAPIAVMEEPVKVAVIGNPSIYARIVALQQEAGTLREEAVAAFLADIVDTCRRHSLALHAEGFEVFPFDDEWAHYLKDRTTICF